MQPLPDCPGLCISAQGKTILWFDFLSNHSSSGTGAKEQAIGRRHRLAITFFILYFY